MADRFCSCILNVMGDDTFRYGQGAPSARVQGPARKRTGVTGPARPSGMSDAIGRTRPRDPAAPPGGPPRAGRPEREGAAEKPAGSQSAGNIGGFQPARTGEASGLQRAAALAGRAMAGRGGMRGHGGYASALFDRVPSARRDQEPGGARLEQGSGREQGAGGAVPALGAFQAAPAATYWRRRFVILAIGLSLLAAASWTLSQAVMVSSSTPQRSGQGGQATGTDTSRQGSGRPGDVTSGDAAGQASASRGHGSAAGLSTGHRPQPQPSATTSFGGFKPAFCSWHSIVISLSAAQVHYAPGEQPSFSLSIVSTQPTACSFNVGPSHLALVIKEGPARIWSSADCVNGSGSLVAALHRGVPTVVTIDWNRRTSSPGCSGPVRSVPAGTYTGYAVDGSLTSGPVPIQLN
jgi:hypothetical protein